MAPTIVLKVKMTCGACVSKAATPAFETHREQVAATPRPRCGSYLDESRRRRGAAAGRDIPRRCRRTTAARLAWAGRLARPRARLHTLAHSLSFSPSSVTPQVQQTLEALDFVASASVARAELDDRRIGSSNGFTV